MNTKKILFGLAVFGTGVGTGYFTCKLVLGKRYQEDVSEIKQFYMNKIEEMGVMAEDFDPEDLDEDDDDEDTEDSDEEEYHNTINKFNYSSAATEGQRSKGRPIINYNNPPLGMKNWGDLEEEEPEEEEEELEEDEMDLAYEAELEARAEEFARRRYENRSNGRPYVIDYDEYVDGPDEYAREALYYYSRDRVLCEDDDSVVEEEEELIGFDYEDVLDMQTTAWVRNDTLMILYEIHRIDDSYKMSVENAIETPREREYRVLGRRKQAMDGEYASKVFLE